MGDYQINDKIGVGIIGVTSERGFAAWGHIPALKAMPEYEIRAISGTRRQSVDDAAKKFGVPLAFDDHAELIARPEVDLVVVTVKVPHHLELVTAALEAGKPVFCEWPLGNGLGEAIQMADLARARGVHTAVGLQGRASPVVNRVRDLVKQGYVGEVRSATLTAAGWWGGVLPQSDAYLADKKNGATLLTISAGHAADALCYCLGEFSELSATLATQRKTVKVAETGETLPMTAEDQIAVTGILENGAAVTFQYRGNLSRGTKFLWEINGTEGDLLVTSDSGSLQMADLKLQGGRGTDGAVAPLPIPDEYRWVSSNIPSGPPFNVAQAYARLACDLRDDTHCCPTFDDAVTRHRMIYAIEQASTTGYRQILK